MPSTEEPRSDRQTRAVAISNAVVQVVRDHTGRGPTQARTYMADDLVTCEIVKVKEWDVVRVPPGTWRGYEAGPGGSRSRHRRAQSRRAPREDVEGQRDWWAG